MFLQLTHVAQHEFSKIGNKVFIPSGVANLFPKIEPLAKHIVPCTLQTINGSTRVKHFQKRQRKKRKQLTVETKNPRTDSFSLRQWGEVNHAPP